MNHFRRMVLLPETEYQVYKRHFTQDASSSSSISLQERMQSELEDFREKYGNTLPLDQRAKLEGDIRTKYITERKNTVAIPVKIDTSGLERQLELFPKQHRQRAQQIYRHLSHQATGSQWNEKGELLVNDQPIHGSNILDLITLFAGHRTGLGGQRLTGLTTFIRLLKDSNIPIHLLGPKGKEYINNNNPVEAGAAVQWESH